MNTLCYYKLEAFKISILYFNSILLRGIKSMAKNILGILDPERQFDLALDIKLDTCLNIHEILPEPCGSETPPILTCARPSVSATVIRVGDCPVEDCPFMSVDTVEDGDIAAATTLILNSELL